MKKIIFLSISEDMENWTHSRNIVLLDEFDDSKVPQIGNNMDLDKFNVIKYNGIFFAFLSLMDNLKISVPVHNHLSWSRDDFDWERLPERPLFIENGQPGEWDDNHIGDMLDIIPEGDRLRIYYRGGKTTQHFHGREEEKNISGFNGTGLAFIGKNRFIGLKAGSEGGYLLTRQFIMEGNKIEINCYSQVQKPAPGLEGLIKAEILQPPVEHHSAIPFPGFSMKDFDPIIVNDNFNQQLTWRGSSDLSSLEGKPVYIRFYIRNSTLYTFRVENSLSIL